MLTRLTDEQLAAEFQATRDASAADELVRRFLPLARTLAARYAHTSEPREDLVQVAYTAFVSGLNRFDVERGSSLRSFAIPTMLGELRRHFRDTGWSLRVPRSLQERNQAARTAVDRLTARLGRSPMLREIGEAIGATAEEVAEALEVTHAYHADSLDLPDNSDDDEPAWHSRHGHDESGYGRVEMRVSLARALDTLDDRQRAIVHMRFDDGLTQSEIGLVLGLSQMHVSRLLRRALERMAVVLDSSSVSN